jgi:predicted PurR-regulated permease PerM
MAEHADRVPAGDGDVVAMAVDDSRAVGIGRETARQAAAERASDGPGTRAGRPGPPSDGPGTRADRPGTPSGGRGAPSGGRGAPSGDGRAERRPEQRPAEASPDRPGPPLSRRSPFHVGLVGAIGVATAYGLVQVVVAARDVLVLVGLALFLAIGLDPAVRWLCRWMPRWAAVTIVVAATVGLVVGFLAAAIPPLVNQAGAFAHELPRYLRQLQDHSSTIGRLNDRYHLQQRLADAVSGNGQGFFGDLIGAGRLVLGITAQTLTVLVLTVYFLADFPRIRQLIYRLVPRSRRPRAVVLGDEMFAKVGGFVLGNLLTSGIAGLGTFVWLLIWHIPYPLLLSLMVALLDLIPVVGSTLAGAIVTLVALTVSLPVAVATLVFYVLYRLAEDYLIVPRVIGRVIEVPATVTLVAVLIGGAILGIVGALVAIPIAAAVRILLIETVFPRLDHR